MVVLEQTRDGKKDWNFFRNAAKDMMWPHIEQQYREELQGITEGLRAKGVKLDLWDVVALNAFCEWGYYVKEYDRQHRATAVRLAGFAGALQRLRRHRQLHEGWQGHHRPQRLDQLPGRRALDHHF